MNTSQNYFKDPLQTLNGPEVFISCCSNVYIRRMTFHKANTIELGHTHLYDHVSYVSLGSCEVQVYDEEKDEMGPPKRYQAPATIFIAKNKIHQLKSLEDNTVIDCVHALRDIDGNIIDPNSFPNGVSLEQASQDYKNNTGKELELRTKNDLFSQHRVPRIVHFDRSF